MTVVRHALHAAVLAILLRARADTARRSFGGQNQRRRLRHARAVLPADARRPGAGAERRGRARVSHRGQGRDRHWRRIWRGRAPRRRQAGRLLQSGLSLVRLSTWRPGADRHHHVHDAAALAGFDAKAGWKVGVDGSVTLITLGAGASIDTNQITSPVIGFVLDPKGLMYNLTLEGSKISRINP